jgi:DtxR family manganese transport transcriptional regulator
LAASNTNRSRPFDRTRHDHASETAEDYVEAIAEMIAQKDVCRGADLAKLFGVSHVTVTKTINRLRRESLVDAEPYRPIRLTSKGKRLAKAARRRHEIVLSFLKSLGVSEAVATTDSEGIEHHVSDETLKAFQRFVQSRNL